LIGVKIRFFPIRSSLGIASFGRIYDDLRCENLYIALYGKRRRPRLTSS
jgi:hypothetical protein